MLVSVIIVNYNTFQITCDCIESIYKFTKGVHFEIIVVDNASPKDNPDLFLTKFPLIKLVKSRENGGFAKGNNLGISIANGDIILLLNSDTYLVEDSISQAATYLNFHNDIGALTVRLVYPDGKLQHTARKFRSIRNELLDIARPLLKLLSYKKRADLMLNQYFNGNYNTYADWVSGAFMMFRKDILQKLPEKKLDERFFMYGEDQLWCYQFTKLGYRNFYLADTTVIHIHNASTTSSQQIYIAKKFLGQEMKIIEYRMGKSPSYYILSFIYTSKELMRHYIKLIACKLFKYNIR